MVAQAGVGYTQYFTHLPALLVEVHILGATALVIGATQTSSPARTTPPKWCRLPPPEQAEPASRSVPIRLYSFRADSHGPGPHRLAA